MSDLITQLYFETLDLHTLPEELQPQRDVCLALSRQLSQLSPDLFDAYEEASSQMNSLVCQSYFRRGIQVAVQLILAGRAPI